MARTSQVETAVSYVVPFALFFVFLAIDSVASVPQWARFAVELCAIAAFSRTVISRAPAHPLMSALLGLGVFVIWIAPDQLFPAYRSLPLFSNPLVGRAISHTTEAQKHDVLFLAFRVLNSALIIPVLEELFWRGFLMRWLINRDFTAVPLGSYTPASFWLVALLFATEHGPYWDVGLIAGAIINWWLIRTRNLADCIILHATANACLAAFVIGAGQWQYWL